LLARAYFRRLSMHHANFNTFSVTEIVQRFDGFDTSSNVIEHLWTIMYAGMYFKLNCCRQRKNLFNVYQGRQLVFITECGS